ncbi:MAG TPA: PAS domain S-box protein, partial [Candidatus Acidoferrales bacterium]|nr:PAS domain S-box protein [Candidatus Acidoferrales bacterium]
MGGIVVETTDSVYLERVRRSEDLLTEAERLANVGSWTIDLLTSEVTLSPNLRSMLRLDDFGLTAKDVWSLVHPDDRERVRRIVETAIKDRKNHEEQARLVFPDGSQKVVLSRGRPILDTAGRAVKAMGITQDITDRIKAQFELEESEARYRDIVENSRSLMCLHDLDGRLLWMNALPAKLLGYSPDELIGRRIPDMLGPDSREGFRQYIKTICRDGYAKGLMAVVSRSGEQRIWEYANTLRANGAAPPLVRGMAHDITERWRAEKLMQRKEEQLRSLSAQLIVSHDREHKRIAQALHEGAAQEISGVQMALA